MMSFNSVRICGLIVLTMMVFSCLPGVTMYNLFSPLDVFTEQFQSIGTHHNGIHRRQTECDVSLCEYTEWSEWTFCYCAICNEFDNSTRRSCLRLRTVSSSPDGCQNDECEGDAIGELQCFEECCNTLCGVTEWSEWLTCNNTCNENGVEWRSRSPYPNECFETCDFEETRPCDNYCEVGEWSEWACSCELCEPDYYTNETITDPLIYDGNETLHRNCTRNGSAIIPDLCEGCDIVFEENVCMENCSCDSSPGCSVNDWSSWSECSGTCGGNQVRTRSYSGDCTAPPCVGTQQSRACTLCPTCTPCDYSEWSQWNTQVTCALCEDNIELSNFNTRTQAASDANCDGECPEIQEIQCGDTCCDEFCPLTDWSEWSQCPEPCGGSQTRAREPISRPICLGEPCSDTEEVLECTMCSGCDLCELSEWTSWSCSCQVCDPTDTELHNQCSRTRFALNDCDTSCFDSIETSCDQTTICCDELCVIDTWNNWGACTQSCGGSRNRTAQYDAALCLGEPCQDTFESEPCVPCPTTEWSEWSCSCSLCQNTVSLADICIRERAYSTDNQCNTNCSEIIEAIDCTDPCCDTFCFPDQWSEWSACPEPCGGTSNRTRTYTASFCLGEPCESLFESQECQTCPDCQPVDCVLTEWTEWSQCNSACDFGVQSRSREISVNQDCGGADCLSDTLEESRDCEGECQLEEWGSWQCVCSLCTGFTDSLYQVCTRERDVTGPNSCDSADCGVTVESGCTDKCCDALCFVSDWSPWSECSSGCGTGQSGIQNRTRIYNEAFCIGEPCETIYEETVCIPDTCCPVDCVTTQWSNWATCSVSCSSESGTRTRDRQVTQGTCGGITCTDTNTVESEACVGGCQLQEWNTWSCACWFCNTGDSVFSNVCSRERQEIGTSCNSVCGSLSETVCGEVCCDTGCSVSEWTTWSPCDQPCGSATLGNETRTRTYNSAFCIGEPCDDLKETRTCTPGCCAVDCISTEWSEWSSCSVICSDATGSRSRSRAIQEAVCGGTPCENDITTETENCQGECVLSVWTEWTCSCSQCDPIGNADYQYCTRTRTESNGLTCGGECGDLLDEECGEICCDPDCSVSDWGDWTDCNVPCESSSPGIRQRFRTAVGTCSAVPCLALDETISCEASCCLRDCVLLSWMEWTTCTSLCTNTPGIRSRTRSIVQGSCGGNLCTETDYTENGLCYGSCDVSEWSDWSCVCGICSADILQDICSRYRNESTDVSCIGQCGASTESVCGDECCDDLCIVGEWTQWTDCSEPCGSGNTGLQTRQRNVISQTCRGDPCDQLLETRECFQGSGCCPVDCELELWSTWSGCSSNCLNVIGNETRTRDVITPVSCGGTSCDSNVLEYRNCYGTTFPANCIEGAWANWSPCALDTGSCGTGSRQRTRSVISEAVCGGLQCGQTAETDICVGPCCPVDCETTAWTEWTGCSTECGTGQQMRFRMITISADCGGVQCISTFERRDCIGTGPSICEFTDWSEWTTCLSSCGLGWQTRSRSILTPAICTTQCISTVTEENQECERYINVDCQVGEWSQWGTCVPDCSGFMKSRSRNVILANSCNGDICPSLSEQSNCNIFCLHTCSVNGQCTCNPGYKLTGSFATECVLVTCQPPVFHSCPLGLTTNVVTCVPPTTSCGAGSAYEYGHTCQLLCESRSGYTYQLMGASPGYTECLANGQWSYYSEVYCTIVNSPPIGLTTFSGNTIFVEENTFGNVLAVLKTEDVDSTWDAYTYTVIDDVHNIINIIDNQIYLRHVLDYELQDRYTVTVRSTDLAGNFIDQEFTFQVTDGNDPPTGVTISNDRVSENSIVNTAVGLLQAVDQDTGQSYTYSLVDNAHGRFRLSDNFLQTAMTNVECELLFNDACFNYGTQKYHDVIVSVQDNGSPMKIEYHTLRIHIEEPSQIPVNLQISSNVIQESSTTGTVIGVVSTDDTNEGTRYVYSLIDNHGGLFKIDPTTGAIILQDSTRINYAAQSAYPIQVTGVDQNDPTNTITREFLLEVSPSSNSPSTSVAILSTTETENYPVNEPIIEPGTQSGQVIGTVVVYDYEIGDVSVEVEGGNGLYETRKLYCSPVNGHEMGYRTVCAYDLYVTSDVTSTSEGSTITLASTNSVGQTTRHTYNIGIASSDVQESTDVMITAHATTAPRVTPNPPMLVFSGDSSPSESLSSNTPIGSITTTDFFSQYTYRIVDDTDNIFQLQDNVLYLSSAAQLDYETASRHEVTIQAVQNGNPSNTIQMTFSFQVEDTNEAPTSIHFSNNQIEFGASVGTSVSTISVNDPDNADGLVQDSNCFITSDDSRVFTINGHSLETTRPLIPGQSTYFLQVRCVDSGTPAMYVDSQLVIDVLVDDSIEIDVILTDYIPFEENVDPLPIGTFHVIDAATGQPITDTNFEYFMMFLGEGFPLTVEGDQLWTTGPLNYEELPKIDVTIQARGTDSYGRELTTAQVFQVDVLDVWEEPTTIQFETTNTHVTTESQHGAVIGSFSPTGEDTDYSDVVYAVTGVGSAGSSDITDPTLRDLVTMDGNVLRMGEGIDYVSFDGDSEEYVIYITASSTSDPNWITELVHEIEIFIINHPPTDITIDNAVVMENVAIGSHVGYFMIVDPDIDEEATCQVLNTNEVPFDIADSNELVTSGPLDFETFHVNLVEIECSDSDGLSFTKTIEISTENVLEPPSFLTLSNLEVNEDAHEGESVGQVYSLIEQGHWVRYSIVQEDVPFEIAGNNTLVLTDTVNYEDVSRYDITVAAELGDDPSLVTYANFSITIKDLNDPPSSIQLAPSSFSIQENAIDGSVVGSFVTIDEDDGQSHEYSILSDVQSTGAFRIEGNQLILVEGSAIDYERHQYIDLLIQTVDDGNPAHSFQEMIRIRVIDTGEPPQDIIYQTPTLPENSPAGTLVTRILVDDPDKNEEHTCSVLRTDTQSGLFDVIRTSNNDIRLVVAEGGDIDYETRPYHRVEVECGDGYNWIRKTITVFVDDVNEPPEGVDLAGSHSVPIDAETGFVVGQLQVHDPDTDQEHTISVSGETSNLFKVDGNYLILAQEFQEELIDKSNPFLQVILKVVDNGPNMLSRTQAYTIGITGLIDFDLQGNEVSELALVGQPIGRFTSDLGGEYESPQYRLIDDADGKFSLTDDNILVLSDIVDYTESPYLFLEAEMQVGDVQETRVFRVSVLSEDPCSTGLAQCLPHSSCVRLSKTEFDCVCHPGYKDINNQCFAVDDCATLNGNPCMYNAPCTDDKNSFSCVCSVGYQGKLCELPPLDPCNSQPCLNDGTCLYSSDYTHYVCQCRSSYTGDNCENGVNDQPLCKDVDCEVGDCFQNGDDVMCECPASHYGIKCQFASGVCSDSSCNSDEYCIPHIRAPNMFLCAPHSESVDINFLNENLGSETTDPFVQYKFNSFVESTNELPDLYVLFASNTPTNVSILVFFIINEAVTSVLEGDYVSCVLYDNCVDSGAIDEFCPDILDQFVSLCGPEKVVATEETRDYLWISLLSLSLAFCLIILLIILAYKRCSRKTSVIHTFEPIITKQEGIRYISHLQHSLTGSSRNNTLTESGTRMTGDYEYFTDTARRPSRLFRRSLFPGGMENARSQSDGQLAQHMYANRDSNNRL